MKSDKKSDFAVCVNKEGEKSCSRGTIFARKSIFLESKIDSTWPMVDGWW